MKKKNTKKSFVFGSMRIKVSMMYDPNLNYEWTNSTQLQLYPGCRGTYIACSRAEGSGTEEKGIRR